MKSFEKPEATVVIIILPDVGENTCGCYCSQGKRTRRFLRGILSLGEAGRVGEQVSGQSGDPRQEWRGAGVADPPAQPHSCNDRGAEGDRESLWGSLGPMERVPVFTTSVVNAPSWALY